MKYAIKLPHGEGFPTDMAWLMTSEDLTVLHLTILTPQEVEAQQGE